MARAGRRSVLPETAAWTQWTVSKKKCFHAAVNCSAGGLRICSKKKVQESQFIKVTVLRSRKPHTQEPGGIFNHVYLTMYTLRFVSWLGVREILQEEGFLSVNKPGQHHKTQLPLSPAASFLPAQVTCSCRKTNLRNSSRYPFPFQQHWQAPPLELRHGQHTLA